MVVGVGEGARGALGHRGSLSAVRGECTFPQGIFKPRRTRGALVLLRSAVNKPPQECYLDWPGDQYRGPKAEGLS